MIKNNTDPDFVKWFNEFLCQDDDGNSYSHLEMAFAAGKKAANNCGTLTVSTSCSTPEDEAQSIEENVASPCQKHGIRFCTECFPVVRIDFNHMP